jgi:predicted hotdog family 3-hydroxylacyl-ACP dehydratase
MDGKLTDWTVDELVPHRGNMSWLSRIVQIDEKCSIAEADIREDMFFLREGRLGVWTGVEFMAQTVAAWAGGRAQRESRSVVIGMLVGSRLYQTHCQHFSVGQTLRIESQLELIADNGLGMFDCKISIDGAVLASARLSVFEPPDAAAFLELQKGRS